MRPMIVFCLIDFVLGGTGDQSIIIFHLYESMSILVRYKFSFHCKFFGAWRHLHCQISIESLIVFALLGLPLGLTSWGVIIR